jgi:hypothetical protein
MKDFFVDESTAWKDHCRSRAKGWPNAIPSLTLSLEFRLLFLWRDTK